MLNNEILRGTYSELLTRLFGVRSGGTPPAPQVSPEISPHVDVLGGAELPYLRQERLCCGYDNFTGAATFSYVGLFNPSGSGVLIIVEAVDYSNGTAGGQAGLAFAAGPIGGDIDSQERYRDGRWTAAPGAAPVVAIPPKPVGTMYAGASRAAITTIGPFIDRATFPTNVMRHVGEPFILPPGLGLIATTVAVTQIVECNFKWREKYLPPSEQ